MGLLRPTLQRLQTIASRRIRHILLTNTMPKVMAQKFGFNGRWTPTDHQLFLTQLESAYFREKGLQKRIEMVDKALRRHPDSRATLEPRVGFSLL
jgi:hypothetical protein